MTLHPQQVLIPLLLAAGLVTGCQATRDTIAQRQALERQRDAARTYANAIPAVAASQDTWVLGLRTLSQQETPRAAAETLRQDVLPALRTYLDRLSALPTPTDKLRAAHVILLAAHARLIDQLSALASALESGHPADQAGPLKAGIAAFHAAQERYLTTLQATYDTLGLDLKPQAPIII